MPNLRPETAFVFMTPFNQMARGLRLRMPVGDEVWKTGMVTAVAPDLVW